MIYPSICLLAPARDIEVGKAAIQAGANAVYIGAPKFGARQGAANTIEDIEILVGYAHKYQAKVLVTLNTLLTDTERKEAADIAWKLHAIGVDALIIQDLRLMEEKLPPIRLHASTQCDNRTIEHIQKLEKAGFKRVVLARELEIDAIREIRNNTTIELEAFVHGALCVSYSGRCYMSEVLMNRSANRGCCAQMCRMKYDLLDKDMNEIVDENGRPIHQRYLLSLKDMDRSMSIREMIDAGVTTFKIEGRLKDKDYVTNIVAYYRQIIDSIIPPPQDQTITFGFCPNPQKTFHRGGTDYFLHGRTRHMANWQTPKSTGEPIGTLVKAKNDQLLIHLNSSISLNNGDGICIEDQGFAVNKIVTDPLKELVSVTINKRLKKTNLVLPQTIYRNLDTAFQRSLHAERHILTDILFEETQKGFKLTIGHESREFEYPHELSTHPENAIENIRKQLSKLGDTNYQVRNIKIMSQPYFIPISKLNEWRRETIQNL